MSFEREVGAQQLDTDLLSQQPRPLQLKLQSTSIIRQNNTKNISDIVEEAKLAKSLENRQSP